MLRTFFGYGSGSGDESVAVDETHAASASSQLAIGGLGVREWMSEGMVERPHGTGDWLCMVFHQPTEIGAQRVGVGTGVVALEAAQTLMIWPPGAAQIYGLRQGPWLHSWIHCRGEAMTKLVQEVGLPCGVALPSIDPGLLERTALDLHQEMHSHPPDPHILISLMGILLRRLARALHPEACAIPPGLLVVRRHLQSHLQDPISLDELAALAGLSSSYLCTSFHEHFGTAPIDYLITLRLEQARWLLRDRNRSIAAVARAVGYHDAHYFARLCRQRLGSSPSQLRDAGLPASPGKAAPR